jgi:hypothetical protein
MVRLSVASQRKTAKMAMQRMEIANTVGENIEVRPNMATMMTLEA